MAFFNEWRNTDEFRQEAIKFLKNGTYIDYPDDTYEYDSYWDQQEKYIKEGFTNSIGQYICGLYYFYLNFVMIYDKSKKKLTFPDFWDTDAWVMDEIEQAAKHGQHIVIVKARQKGGSLKSVVLPLVRFYFQRNSINYIAAYIEDKADRAWEMMAHMADHLDRHTAWGKLKTPEKKDEWKAQFKETVNGREVWSGYKSEMHKLTFKQNPAHGVGGAIDTLLYDEGGLAPTLVKSVQYIDPACSDGAIRTGTMIIVGSVGELLDSQGLKTIFYSPEDYGFRKYQNVWDEKAEGTFCGLFIPEHYSLKGFIDEHGNSKLQPALEWCKKEREKKKKLNPEEYRLYVSQHPIAPEEAFAQRRESNFPVQLIDLEMQRIKNDSLWGVTVNLEYNESGKVYHNLSTSRKQVMEFPVKQDTDKRGATVIYEHPPKDGAPWGMYFGGVDPVKNVKTDTSVSLAALYIYKRRTNKNGVISGDEVVACYVGRFDDPKQHHEEMEKLIEYYNAWTLVENNVSSFIEHMIQKKKQRYLMRKHDVALIQEMNLNANTHAIYGITASNASNRKLIEMIIEFLKQTQEKIFDSETGNLIKEIKGVQKIKDYMLLQEMLEHREDINVDRLMAFGYALMAANSMAQHTSMDEKDNSLDYVEENKRINAQIQNTAFTRLNRAIMAQRNPDIHKQFQPFRVR